MPILKDLRNRIASVKSTQKITKAMQMVAAAKLRRAQAAAEAARPYAERMDAGAGQSRRRRRPPARAPRLLAGTGAEQTHLLLVCTAERGLCGAFNSSIARLARDSANRLMGAGQDGQDHLRRQERLRLLRRQLGAQILDLVDLRAVRTLSYENADAIAQKVIALFEKGEFDVCTLFFSRFKSVIAQIPTAQQLIPAELGREAAARRCGLRLRAGRGRNPDRPPAARGHGAGLPRVA